MPHRPLLQLRGHEDPVLVQIARQTLAVGHAKGHAHLYQVVDALSVHVHAVLQVVLRVTKKLFLQD